MAHGTQRIGSDGTKECARCRVWLPADQFPRNGRVSSGLHSYCRELSRDAVRRSRAKASAGA